METNFTINSKKKKGVTSLMIKVVSKWITNYINLMSKVLYPPDVGEEPDKSDKFPMFHK